MNWNLPEFYKIDISFYVKNEIKNMSEPGLGLIVKDINEIQKIVDVALMLDATASMGDEIQAAAETMISNVEKLKSMYPNCVFRLALVVYRDYDEDDEFVINDFTTNVESIVAILKGQLAVGGNDAAENVAGALARVLDLSWRGDICQVFWVADAPAHGDRYHTSSVSDSYRDGDRGGLDPEILMHRLAKQNIGISFFKMNSTTDKMIDVLDAAYQSGRSPGNKANFIIADVSAQLCAAKKGSFDLHPAPHLPEFFRSPSSEAYQEQFLSAVSSQLD
jgi:hypothetical protein